MANDFPVQVVRKGLVREGEEGHDPAFVANAIDQLFHHWITPAVGAFVPRSSVNQALIVMDADVTHVFINHDVRFWAIAGENATVVDPADAFIGQITSLLPEGVDPRLAWMGFATAIGGRAVVLDLASSVERVTELLTEAANFLRSAQWCIENELLSQCVEQLFGAAELAIITLIYLDGWDDEKKHYRRAQWVKDQIRAGNIPPEFGAAFKTLYANRNKARYVEPGLTLTLDRATEITGTVGHMIQFARSKRDTAAADTN